MSRPAARIGDMHVCPMVTPATPPVPHVGGPITGPGVPTVLINGMPAAVMGDMCVCTGPPDVIAKGNPTVLIGNKPAVCMGDTCAHGGTITVGSPNVLIGMNAGGASVTLPAAQIPIPRQREFTTWETLVGGQAVREAMESNAAAQAAQEDLMEEAKENGFLDEFEFSV